MERRIGESGILRASGEPRSVDIQPPPQFYSSYRIDIYLSVLMDLGYRTLFISLSNARGIYNIKVEEKARKRHQKSNQIKEPFTTTLAAWTMSSMPLPSPSPIPE